MTGTQFPILTNRASVVKLVSCYNVVQGRSVPPLVQYKVQHSFASHINLAIM